MASSSEKKKNELVKTEPLPQNEEEAQTRPLGKILPSPPPTLLGLSSCQAQAPPFICEIDSLSRDGTPVPPPTCFTRLTHDRAQRPWVPGGWPDLP